MSKTDIPRAEGRGRSLTPGAQDPRTTRGRSQPPPLKAYRSNAYMSFRTASRERSPHSCMSPDLLSRNASPVRTPARTPLSRKVSSDSVERQQRIRQPYFTSFSAVTSPRPSASDPDQDTEMFSRGGPVRATMPGRIVPISNQKQAKSHDDILSSPKPSSCDRSCDSADNLDVIPVERYGAHAQAHRVAPGRHVSFTNGQRSFSKSDPRVNHVNGDLHVQMNYNSLDRNASTRCRSPPVHDDAVFDFMGLNDNKENQKSKYYVEGTVYSKKLIEKEYVHVCDIDYLLNSKKPPIPANASNSVTSSNSNGRNHVQYTTGKSPRDNFLLRSYRKSKAKFNKARGKPESAPTTPQNNRKGPELSIAPEENSSSSTPTTLDKKKKSSSLHNFFKKFSPKARKKSMSNVKSSSSVSGSQDSIEGVFVVPIHTSNSRSEGDLLDDVKMDKRANHFSTGGLENQTSSPGTEGNMPSKSARMLKSMENNPAKSNDKDIYHAFKERQTSPSTKHSESMGMKPQALKAVEFPADVLVNGTPKTNISSSASPGANKSKTPTSGGSVFTTPPSTGITQESSTKRLEPPRSLNVRSVTKLDKNVFQFPSVSTDSIGECSLDLDAGSEPSLASKNGHQGSPALGSKNPLSSRENMTISPPKPSTATSTPSQQTYSPPKAETRVAWNSSTNKAGTQVVNGSQNSAPSTMPLNDITSTDNVKSAPRTPSYLKLSKSVGGYNKYSSYSENKKICVIKRTDAQNGSISSTDSDKTLQPNGDLDIQNDLEAGQGHIDITVKSRTPVNGESINTDVSNSKLSCKSSTGAIENGVTAPEVNGVSSPGEDCVDNIVLHKQNGDVIPPSDISLDLKQDNIFVKKNKRVENLSDDETLDTPTPSKDGDYFLPVVAHEEDRLNELCKTAENYLEHNTMSDDVQGRIRTAIGKANLLTTKKFKQFKGLCQQNMNQTGDEEFHTTAQDLAGFWDMVMIQVDDVIRMFAEIEKIREAGWQVPDKNSPVSSQTNTPKSAGHKPRSAKSTPKSAKALQAAKAREEARRKLLQAKRAGRQRQISASDKDGEVEIFVS